MLKIDYPTTKRIDVTETYFGQAVSDPYRWLENDIRSDINVAAWVEAQNKATGNYLSTLPGRDVFRQRLTALFDHHQVTAPRKRGDNYFHTRNSGLENQPVLYVREGVSGQDRVLVDPNGWSDDGATALAEWAVSDDGSKLAYAVQDGGTDWRTIRILDTARGEVLDDEVKWARFSEISWTKTGSGFFYSRYPEDANPSQGGVSNHAIYFHRVGTSQSQDRLIYATPDQPHFLNLVDLTEDGRYAIVYSMPGVAANTLSVIDLTSDDWAPRALVADLQDEWSVLGNVGTVLYLVTSRNAERRKIVTLDLEDAAGTFKELVSERDAVLSNAWLVGGRLIATYLVDAKSEVHRFRLDGTSDGVVELPGIGSAGGFRGGVDDNEAFFVFTSLNAPTTVYRYDVATNKSSIWAKPDAGFDFDRILVEQKFYLSKDGTRVPMFVVRRKDVTGPAPTVLYGYGGFGIAMLPFYSPAQMAWVEQGGVMAIANIRGGGEYGKAWHDAGRFQNKQNSFDDFIAAGEYLKAQAISSTGGLAIQGESGRGLLVGAVVNQRPDLFAAALPGVGVMDMLRYAKFSGGQYWMTDFGDPAVEEHFRNLLAYSPYHNIAPGQPYPAILATTADTDDRVVPGHTFKYIAALQAADLGPKPRLVRIETRAGHGAGKPTSKIIDELADQWAFVAYWTGLKVRPLT
ncbi:prolyl oligopeptidase family serine peptidase [Rhizobium sp. AN80A]|uniref:prolyl oligopeptidase family serine peptidase n=1 Tax=Rhizobium sp. AN80A TaxID=3040673 RepID=UPI0024B338E9|nr:prolyl oligopeptidase family serine peptidase [Rhizobium sp. AN80A]